MVMLLTLLSFFQESGTVSTNTQVNQLKLLNIILSCFNYKVTSEPQYCALK